MSNAKSPRGLVIAAPSSGAGKTTATLGLLAAFKARGVTVQPFKTGPDYLDTGHHARAAGRPSYNLDVWAMSRPLLEHIVTRAGQEADLCIVEGVMGLFDGGPDRGLSGRGASADIAALLGWPVILVLDVSAQTETAAALALGCARYRDDINIAGVILNQIASDHHLDLIRPGFERVGIPILGALRRDQEVKLPERHLGLVQAGESANESDRLDRLAGLMERFVDLDAVRRAATEATIGTKSVDARRRALRPPGQRIALASDGAFSFTYAHVLADWREAGAEIMPFAPLADEAPCQRADAVWLPGGYPELHAGRIATASRFQAGVRTLAANSVPIHGECGGYMVLGQGLEDADGTRHAMLGLLPAETSFRMRKMHLGYRRATLKATCALGREGAQLFGHEFHFATLLKDDGEPLLDCTDGSGGTFTAGSRVGRVTGSFFHVISSVDAVD